MPVIAMSYGTHRTRSNTIDTKGTVHAWAKFLSSMLDCRVNPAQIKVRYTKESHNERIPED